MSNSSLNKSNIIKLATFLEENDFPNILSTHGFLAAIISGPNTIMPSEWMSFLGINNIEYKSMNDANEIMGSLMGMYNDIASQFQEEDFHVINPFSKSNDDERDSAQKSWARGYMMGVSFDKDSWLISNEISSLLFPIMALNMSDKELVEALKENSADFPPEVIKSYGQDKLSEIANKIYQYWLDKRTPPGTRVKSTVVKIGRNEPCYCGSGKKYKKCCLH